MTKSHSSSYISSIPPAHSAIGIIVIHPQAALPRVPPQRHPASSRRPALLPRRRRQQRLGRGVLSLARRRGGLRLERLEPVLPLLELGLQLGHHGVHLCARLPQLGHLELLRLA